LELRDNLEDARETEENFVHYFADFLELHAVDLAEGDWILALQEIENFQKAWNLAVSFDDHYSLKMMSMGLWFAFEYSGRYDLCLSIFEKGVDQLRTGVLGDGRALALGLLLIPYGFQMIVVKDVQAGWKAMNEGLQLLKKMGSEIELGIAVIFMAATGVLSIDDGIKRLEDALKVFRQGQGLWMEGEAQAQYGLYLLRAGRLDEARDQFKRCIELGEKKSYRRVLAMGFNGLAEYYSERGDVHAAIEYCSKALTAFQDCRLINAQARLHLELGQYYSQTDELLLAKQNLTKALELLKGSGFTERIAFCHLGLGNLAYKSGDLPEARRAYHQVLTYGLELNHEELLMGSLMEMAVVYSGGSEKTLAFVLTQVILATAFDWRQVKARAGKMAERLECELPEETVAALKAEASAKDILVLGREVLELLNNDVSVN
jgi:tetratricopeptide (TPR) repeat protein